MFVIVQHHAGEPDQGGGPHGVPDHREGFDPDLVVGEKVIRRIEVDFVDFLARHEGVDIDGVGAFQRHFVEFLGFQQHIGAVGHLITLDPVLLGNIFPGFGVNLPVAYTVTGLAINDVEADPFPGRGGLNQADAAGDQGKLEETLPIRPRCHGKTPNATQHIRAYNAWEFRGREPVNCPSLPLWCKDRQISVRADGRALRPQ